MGRLRLPLFYWGYKMPKVWENLVSKIKAKKGAVNPYAVATSVLQRKGVLKPGTRELKKK